MEFVAIDLEANNDRADPSEHEIVEIGAVRWDNGGISDRFSTLVAPTRPLTKAFTRLTGIDEKMLESARPLKEAMEVLVGFVGSTPVVAHNGFGYDFPLLRAAAERIGLAKPEWLELDSLELAHLVCGRAGPNMPRSVDGTKVPISRSLGSLVEWFQIERPGSAHRAASDAEACALLVVRLLEEFGRPLPVRDLQRWLLHVGDHPWNSFATQSPVLPPPLEDVIPSVPQPKSRPPAGVYNPLEVADMLGPDGSLIREPRQYRPQQHEMAKVVAGAFAEAGSRPVLVEAPTGTGKTLAYLVPAIAWARASGSKVAIAAHTKVLQNQIVASLEDLEQSDGVEVNWALLKGRANYLDVEAIADLISDIEGDRGLAFAVAVIIGWAAETPTGDWDDLRVFAIEKRLPELRYLTWMLSLKGDPGPVRTELDRRCFYRRTVEKLRVADIAVLNHALIVTNDEATADVHHLVLDEAHNLEDTATSTLSDEVGEADIGRLVNVVWDQSRRRGIVEDVIRRSELNRRDPRLQTLARGLGEVSSRLDALGPVLVSYIRLRTGSDRRDAEAYGTSYRIRAGLDTAHMAYQSTADAGRGLRDALRLLAGMLGELGVPPSIVEWRRRRLERTLAAASQELREYADTIDGVLWDTDRDEWINLVDLSLTDGAWFWSVRRVPVTVSPWLHDLWRMLDTAILTSATLRAGNDFAYITNALGLAAVTSVVLDTPFVKLSENHRVILTDHLPTPRQSSMDEFIAAEAREIPRMILASQGRALVLFTAWRRLEAVKTAVREALEPHGLDVLAQGEDPAPALIDRMRSDTYSSLLAVRSFWEGIDVPGEALSMVVVEKIPFESPGDPVVAARLHETELQGRDPFGDYLVPRAALRFAQGVGRLIRSDDDVGVTVVLDSRLRRPTPYRDRILGSLVGPPSFLRPGTDEEVYRLISEHLRVAWSDELAASIASLDTGRPWVVLRELQLSTLETGDEGLVAGRLEQVRELFGFEEWRPGQLETMLRFIRGEDVMAILPTGFGKSVTFQIPALIGPGLTLVVSPLVALMRDQVQGLRDLGLTSVAAIHSGQSSGEQRDVLRSAASGKLKLLYVSPERLWSPAFRSALADIEIARVAVDEAHCISQWGHTFRPEYTAIPEAINALTRNGIRPPLLAATATATPRARDEVLDLLGMRLESEAVVASPDRSELHYYVERCRDKKDRDRMVVRVAEAFKGAAAIVYVPTPKESARLTALLRTAGHNVRPYHGRLPVEERLYVEDAFRHGEVDVVVATKAFGLGIDKPDIELILHLEMPASIEEFVQETGRAARGSITGVGPARGVSVLLSTPGDCHIHSWFTKQAAPRTSSVRALWQSLSPGRNYLCADDLPVAIAQDFTSGDQLALAVHYLARAGSVTRRGDTAWQGRVWIPEVAPVVDTPASLRERFDLVVAAADRLGTNEFSAPRWSRQLGLEPDALTELMLELDSADLLGFVVWQFALCLDRSLHEPDWKKIEEWAGNRKELVSQQATEAREYSRRVGCRRKPLLEYLGFPTADACSGCDHCVSLPRPWQDIDITLEDLAAASPARRTALWLIHDARYRSYSERKLARTLVGESDGKYPLSAELEQHPAFGHLASHDVNAVLNLFQEMVDEGLTSRRMAEMEGRSPYPTLDITEAGRAMIR